MVEYSEADVYQKIDRLVSASSPSDALESLASISSSIRFPPIIDRNSDDQRDEDAILEEYRADIFSIQKILAESDEFMSVICSLLSESTIPNLKTQTIDGGDAAACEFLLALFSSMEVDDDLESSSEKQASSTRSIREQRKFQSNAQLKKFLRPSSDQYLTHALLDLISHPTSGSVSAMSSITTSLYAKTSAIKILSKLTAAIPTLLHSQILAAPEGLNRILDLLSATSEEEESIRNESLILCTIMAKTNSGSARLMIFGETYEKVMTIAADDAVGSAVRGDCLKLCIELTRQDEMGSEVFLGSGALVRQLAKFLDLRLGQNFMNPEEELHDEEDDLDDILGNGGKADDKSNSVKKPKRNIPYLTKEEASVAELALGLFRVLADGNGDYDIDIKVHEKTDDMLKKRSRKKSILSNDFLTRLVIDLALYTLPPPDAPISMFVSAVPTLNVQLLALDVLATLAYNSGDELQREILSKRGVYLNAGVLDRIMYLICTGDGANREPMGDHSDGGADKISIHCLGVLRYLLSAQEASAMMIHTLSPPPLEEEGVIMMDNQTSEVQKLVNTLGENIHVLLSAKIRHDLKEEDKRRISRMIIGSSGAIGIFLTNGAGETSREILLRVPVPPPPPTSTEEDSNDNSPSSLVECMISFVDMCTNDPVAMSDYKNVVSAILRLLAEWVPSTPDVISAIFTSASSVALGVLLQSKSKTSDAPTISAFSGILLGLCMANMKANDDIGGWSISSIMNLISVGLGMGKFTKLLEGLKKYLKNEENEPGIPPWTFCEAERLTLLHWYIENVNIVRKKAVQELTLSCGNSSDSDSGDESYPSKSTKSLKMLVSQQNIEIEDLKTKLAAAQDSFSVVSNEVKGLKKRLEANPSQLDDILNESASKVSELEVKNKELVLTMRTNEKNFEKVLNEKESSSSELKTTLEKERQTLKEILEDKNSLQEELTGLTTAYTNLEEEYNRVAIKDGESTEEVMPMSSYQILKDENAKLKHDMKTSNNWMKKAQNKIQDLNQRNGELNEKLKVIASETSSSAKLLEDDIKTKDTAIFEMKSQIDFLANERDKLKIEVEALKSDKVKIHESQQRSDIANSDLKNEIGIVTAEKDRLKNDVEALKYELSTARESLQRTEDSTYHHEQIGQLTSELTLAKEKILENSQQYAASISGLELGLASKEQIISDLEQKISDLSRPSQIDISVDEEKVKKLNDEIKKLAAANKSANEWMTGAHQRNASLKEQVKVLKKQIDDLTNDTDSREELTALQETIKKLEIEKECQTSKMIELETKLINFEEIKAKEEDNVKHELENNMRELSILKEDNCKLKENISVLKRVFEEERESLMSEKEEALSNLKHINTELAIAKKEAEDLRVTSYSIGSESEDQNAVISRMATEIQTLKDENDSLVISVEEHVAAIEDMRNRLTEFHSWSETAQQRIQELEGEKSSAEEKIKLLESKIESENNSLETNQVQINNASQELGLANILKEKDQLEIEMQALKKQLADTKQVRLNEGDDGTIQGTEEMNRNTNFITSLEDEKLQLESKVRNLEESEINLKEQCKLLKNELDQVNIELKCAKENTISNVSDLEEKVKLLELQNQEYLASIENIQYEKDQGMNDDKESLALELSNLRDELSTIENEKIDAFTKIEEMKKVEAALREDYQNLCESKKLDEAELNVLNEDIESLKIELDDLKQMNRDLQSKAELLDEVEENMFEKETEVSELQDALKQTKDALSELQAESEEAIVLWKEKVDDLENEISRLEKEVSQQQEEAKEAISLWEQRCSSLEEDVRKMEMARMDEEELVHLREDVKSKQVIINDLVENLKIENENVIRLEKERNNAESIFKAHIDELEKAIGEHLSSNDQLQHDLIEKENVIAESEFQIESLTSQMMEVNQESEEVVRQWQDTCKGLEDTISDLEESIAKQNESATSAIEQWESRCSALMNQVAELEDELCRSSNYTVIEDMKKELKEKNSLVKEFEDRINILEVNQKIHLDQRNQLKQENSSIEQSLKSEKMLSKDLLVEIEHLKTEVDTLQSQLSSSEDIQKAFDEVQYLLETTKEELSTIHAERKEREAHILKEKENLEKKINSIEDEKKRLNEAILLNESDMKEMKLVIGQLENELNEANDALQAHITDEVTVRATEKAAAALRTQIKELREKQAFHQQDVLKEKEARLYAEAEVEQLKNDVAILAQVVAGKEEGDGQLEYITSKAASEIMQSGRVEISNLQQSLNDTIAELKKAKLKEQDAEDRAASSQMHASVCEQELLSLKSTLERLKTSLQCSKESEEEVQSVLEKRIKCLEQEKEKLLHADRHEFDILKNELSNTIVERDQLIHALDESEKANSTLVYSTTIDIDKENGEPCLELELSKLRMENAQLLCTASKTAKRTERRIKKAFCGEIDSSDDDNIDVKITHERDNLASLKSEHEKLSMELVEVKNRNSKLLQEISELKGKDLSKKIKQVESDLALLEVQKLNTEKDLKEKLETARQTITKVEEKYKDSQSRIRKLENVERKELELAAEIAKIQEENKGLRCRLQDSSTVASNTEAKEIDVVAFDQLDLIRDLQSEMNAEREMYQELLSEHEDLLALLAQQDCEKKFLQQALAEFGGNDAIEKAIHQAEATLL